MSQRRTPTKSSDAESAWQPPQATGEAPSDRELHMVSRRNECLTPCDKVIQSTPLQSLSRMAVQNGPFNDLHLNVCQHGPRRTERKRCAAHLPTARQRLPPGSSGRQSAWLLLCLEPQTALFNVVLCSKPKRHVCSTPEHQQATAGHQARARTAVAPHQKWEPETL